MKEETETTTTLVIGNRRGVDETINRLQLENLGKIFNHPEQTRCLLEEREKSSGYDSEDKAMDDLYTSLDDFEEKQAYNFDKPEFQEHLINALNRVKYVDCNFKRQQEMYMKKNENTEEINNNDEKEKQGDSALNRESNLDINNSNDLQQNNVDFLIKKKNSGHYGDDYYKSAILYSSPRKGPAHKILIAQNGNSRNDVHNKILNSENGYDIGDSNTREPDRDKNAILRVPMKHRKGLPKTRRYLLDTAKYDAKKKRALQDEADRFKDINKLLFEENNEDTQENIDGANALEESIAEFDNEINTKDVDNTRAKEDSDILNAYLNYADGSGKMYVNSNGQKFRKRRKDEEYAKSIDNLSESNRNSNENFTGDINNETTYTVEPLLDSQKSGNFSINNKTKNSSVSSVKNNIDGDNHNNKIIVTNNYDNNLKNTNINNNYNDNAKLKVSNNTNNDTQPVLKSHEINQINVVTPQQGVFKIATKPINATAIPKAVTMIEATQGYNYKQLGFGGLNHTTAAPRNPMQPCKLSFVQHTVVSNATKPNITDELKIAQQISDFVHNLLTHAAATGNMRKELGLCKTYDKEYTPIKNNNRDEDEIMKGMVKCLNRLLIGTSKYPPCGEMPPELMQFMDWLLLNGISAREEFKHFMSSEGGVHKMFLFSKADNETGGDKCTTNYSKPNDARSSLYKNLKNTILGGLSPYFRYDNMHHLFPLISNHLISHRNIEVPALYNDNDNNEKDMYGKYNAPLLYPELYKRYTYDGDDHTVMDNNANDDWLRNNDNDPYINDMPLSRHEDYYSRVNSGRPRLIYNQGIGLVHDNDESQFDTSIIENADLGDNLKTENDRE